VLRFGRPFVVFSPSASETLSCWRPQSFCDPPTSPLCFVWGAYSDLCVNSLRSGENFIRNTSILGPRLEYVFRNTCVEYGLKLQFIRNTALLEVIWNTWNTYSQSRRWGGVSPAESCVRGAPLCEYSLHASRTRSTREDLAQGPCAGEVHRGKIGTVHTHDTTTTTTTTRRRRRRRRRDDHQTHKRKMRSRRRRHTLPSRKSKNARSLVVPAPAALERWRGRRSATALASYHYGGCAHSTRRVAE